MPDHDPGHADEVLCFGAFRFFPRTRLLELSGAPLPLGGRALDILAVLLARAGEVVSQRELVSQVWPGLTVDPSNLRVHLVALRKALGDGRGGARYIATVAGRGYCFVGQVARETAARATVDHAASIPPHGLPARLTRMIGREDSVQAVTALLMSQRFVTIAGPGGIGKTTVAVAAGHRLLAAFAGMARFVDLAPLDDPDRLPVLMAGALGLPAHADVDLPALVRALHPMRLLLILDNCEHLIDPVAELVEQIFSGAPSVHILATSREPLRVGGEHVHRLLALDCPPAGGLTAAEVLCFPAAQLFVDRVTENCNNFQLDDADAPFVADICRKLDGLALAIELAAGGVEAYGIRGTAALVDNRFGLSWRGRRTAQPRHQTLKAALDWSFDLLSDAERAVLRRLAIFKGIFTIEAAQAVAGDDQAVASEVLDALANLVAKSLIAIEFDQGAVHYRLLEVTRSYVLAKLIASGERNDIARRHALFYAAQCRSRDHAAMPPSHADNLRAALTWSFSTDGDPKLGVALAAVASDVFLEMSAFAECRYWAEKALAILDDTTRVTNRSLELHLVRGLSAMFTAGDHAVASDALRRGMDIADILADPYQRLRLLGAVQSMHIRTGELRDALAITGRIQALAEELADATAIEFANWLLGSAYHLIGDQAAAHRLCEGATQPQPPAHRFTVRRCWCDHRLSALCARARSLWLRGFFDQAMTASRAILNDAETMRHPLPASFALIWLMPLFIWADELDAAATMASDLAALAQRHALLPSLALATGIQGRLAIKRGDPATGVALLRDFLARTEEERYRYTTQLFSADLAEGLALFGLHDEALALFDSAISQTEQAGGSLYLPEMLRLRAALRLAIPVPDPLAAEHDLRGGLDLARQQSALAWELRIAADLARLWSGRRRGADDAVALLTDVLGRFPQGQCSRDLVVARRLLDGLTDKAARASA